MKHLIEQFSYAQLAWLVVFSYAVHYLEEAPRLVKWINVNDKMILSKGIPHTQTKLHVENIIMFSLTTATVILLNLFPAVWFLRMAALGWGFGLLSNTWYHAKPTIANGVYSPGVVTAAFFFPVTIMILVEKALLEGFLTLPMVALSMVWGPAGYIGLIIFTHAVLFRGR